MTKTDKLISAAVIMAVAGIIYLGYALTHPEASLPFPNGVTYAIYCIYTLAVMTLIAFASKYNRQK